MKPARRIAHLDMDAFFASVELLRYPQLRGEPVVVGGRRVPAPKADSQGQLVYTRLKDYAGRGVVTTSTYEARALGVFSGMGLMQSARLAPEAVLLPADFEAYRHHSREFKRAVQAIAPIMEDRGIDEIYVDLSAFDQALESTEALAIRIKQAVRQATGLSCSVGISPNKLLSKICSDLQKPDGLTIIGLEDVASRIWPLPVSKVNGIGPKATLKLQALGIHTIGELAAADLSLLHDQFGGLYGRWLHQVAQGIDDRPVLTERDPKSMSRETTFERNLHVRHDRTALTEIINQLCERVAADLASKALTSQTIGIKVKFADFSVVTRDITLMRAVQDAKAIRQAVSACLKRVTWHDRIRLLGVRASSLSAAHEETNVQQLLDI
jgi:DNA polymerase IV